MTRSIFFISAISLFSLAAAAHAARVTNMDNEPHNITVQTAGGTQKITLAPQQSYSTGSAMGTVTTENGKELNLKGYQKSVIKDGDLILRKGSPAYAPHPAVTAPRVVH